MRAIDVKTGNEVRIGDTVKDHDGNPATLVDLVRVNEMYYGGHRSGKVAVRWPGDRYTMEYYDGVFDLRVEE